MNVLDRRANKRKMSQEMMKGEQDELGSCGYVSKAEHFPVNFCGGW